MTRFGALPILLPMNKKVVRQLRACGISLVVGVRQFNCESSNQTHLFTSWSGGHSMREALSATLGDSRNLTSIYNTVSQCCPLKYSPVSVSEVRQQDRNPVCHEGPT